MRNNEIRITACDYHRNGVCGVGFTVVLFDWKEAGSPIRHMMATMHGDNRDGYIAVLDRDMVSAGEVRFGYNSWRGDDFESRLRELVEPLLDAQFAEAVSGIKEALKKRQQVAG